MESTVSIGTSWRKLALEAGSNSQTVFSSKILSAEEITMANSVNMLVQSKLDSLRKAGQIPSIPAPSNGFQER